MGIALWLSLTYLAKFTPFTYDQIGLISENAPQDLVRAGVTVQAVSSAFIFLAPALLFAYLSHPRPAYYLGLRASGKKIQWLLVILLMLGAMPVLELIESLVSNINFGAKVRAEQAAADSMMAAFLNMPTFAAFARAFVVIAIIPAVGEEMFFRGILLRLVKKQSHSMVLPVIFTAAVFSFVHSNVYGYLSIFLAGVLLAVIYNMTGSLWCSIVGHLFFNGSQIVLGYINKAFISSERVSAYLVAGGAVLFCISFYLLLKNKTPLPPNWADDFTPEELSAQQ